MPLHVPVSYGDLLEFLEDYRANLSQLQYVAPIRQPVRVGDDVDLVVTVPVLGEAVTVRGRVMAPMGDRAGLQLDSSDAGLSQLEGFYRFVGGVVEQLLVSGRFKIVGQWEDGAAPVYAGARSAGSGSGASASGSSETPDPALLGPPERTGATTAAELTPLLMELYRQERSGILECRSDAGRRLAYLSKGGIVQWISDPVVEEHCLGVLLARAGRLTPEQLNESLQRMSSSGQKQGQCLIEMGVVTFPQLVMSLMTQVEIIARAVLTSGSGQWSFWPLAALPNSIVTPPMKTPGFLYAFFRKHFAALPKEEVEQRLAEVMDKYAVLAPDVNWGDMRLKKGEQRFMEILGERSYRLREVFGVSNAGRAGTEQVLLSLIAMGLLTIVEGEDRDQVEERWREALAKKVMFMQDQNPFEVLEAHWTSRTENIETAYQRMKTEYTNFARGAVLPPDTEALRQKILGMIERAHAALATTAVRQETRKKYFEPMQHEFSADLLFKQAEMLMVRDEWVTALDNLERAIELNPAEANYRKFRDMAKNKQGGRFTD